MAHIVHDPNLTVMPPYDVEEPCPGCGESVCISIDYDQLDLLVVTCPYCGMEMMICCMCPGPCDWKRDVGCHMRRMLPKGV